MRSACSDVIALRRLAPHNAICSCMQWMWRICGTTLASDMKAACALTAGLLCNLRPLLCLGCTVIACALNMLWRRSGADVFPNFLGYLKDNNDESFKRRGYFLKARTKCCSCMC